MQRLSILTVPDTTQYTHTYRIYIDYPRVYNINWRRHLRKMFKRPNGLYSIHIDIQRIYRSY